MKESQTMRYLFIVNPIAGVGARRDFPAMLLGACRDKGVKGKVFFTRCAGDAKRIINKYNEKFDVFVAVGGDGTMNEVASALVGTSKVMGLIPAGSGNALGREFGISMQPQKAVVQLLNSKIVAMDTGIVNGRRFMNVCGMGFDDHIARCFAKAVNRGPIPYFKSATKEFFRYKPRTYEVVIDGEASSYKAFVLTFANNSQYGNNAYIAPKASMTDGWLDVCVLKPFGLVSAPALAMRLFNKTLDQSKHCIYIKAKNIVIKGKNLNFHVDGEPVNNKELIEISIDPLSLNILVP